VKDGEQPRFQVRAGRELFRIMKGFYVSVLNQVLRVRLIARQAQRRAVQAVEIAERLGLEPSRRACAARGRGACAERSRGAVAALAPKHRHWAEYNFPDAGLAAEGAGSWADEPQICDASVLKTRQQVHPCGGSPIKIA
jgi:hypothetical protein